MLIYSIKTGVIVANIPTGQPYENLYDEPLSHIILESEPLDWQNYRVVNNVIVKMNEDEIEEVRVHNRILSEDERLENEMLNKLSPSYEEIKKAEATIEILTLLQEVM